MVAINQHSHLLHGKEAYSINWSTNIMIQESSDGSQDVVSYPVPHRRNYRNPYELIEC